MSRSRRAMLGWVAAGLAVGALLMVGCVGGALWLLAESFDHDTEPPPEIVDGLARHRQVLEREGDRLLSDPASCPLRTGVERELPYSPAIATSETDGDLRVALDELGIVERYAGYCTAIFRRDDPGFGAGAADALLLRGTALHTPFSDDICRSARGSTNVSIPIIGEWHLGFAVKC